jgi:2-polyprenyl-3-methyl-5-hydroxy-6-metoxy-1,4-benzoquinol methylase
MLILGCGGCSILDGFSDSELKSVLGIDLSKEGIELAKRYSSKKVRFAVADMISYPYDGRYDVILFSESINYVPQSLRESFLARLAGHLKPGGVFVATLAQAQRYREILQSVRRSFLVQEDRTFLGTSRHLIVFSSHNDMKPS